MPNQDFKTLASRRLCIVCQKAVPRTDFIGLNRTCEPCVATRLRGAPTRVAGPKTVATGNSVGNYVPTDLRPFDGRPGAMTAASLPSLRFGKRVYPRGYGATEDAS